MNIYSEINAVRIATALAIILGGAVAVTAQELTLVEDGIAVMDLMLPEEPEPDETLAAEELTSFVERMSGATLSRARGDEPGAKVYLGRAAACPSLEFLPGFHLGPEQYLVASVGTDLYLVGGTSRAVLWAAYGMLHELGCRWYMPGDMGEVVPERRTITVDAHPRIEGPDFPYRQIWYSWGGPADGASRFGVWRRRNRLGHPDVRHGHNLTNSMPPKASFEKRPELYSLVSSARVKQQVCTSNPEVVRLITETVSAFFDKYPDTLCYSLCPDDNRDFCECDACRLLDTGATDQEGYRIVTDRYVTFLNQVAAGIQERHPGKMVSMYAYVNHSTPPVRTPVSPYVVVFFTSSVYCGGHGIGDTSCTSRMAMKSDLEAWARVCPNMYIYEYDPIPGNAELPWPLFGARVREMLLYRALGIQGLSMESHCSWATLSPNHWVTAQCLWDADGTVDDMLLDFCLGFFGLTGEAGVAEAMGTFYGTLERALAAFEPKIDWGQRDIPDIFTPDVVKTCRRALDEAMTLANGAVTPETALVRQRLHMVDLGFRYLEQYLVCRRIDREGGDFQAFTSAYEACEKLLDEMVATNTDFTEVHSSYPGLRNGLGDVMATRFPAELGLVTTWHAIGPFDNAGGAGHDRVYPPEQAVDLNAEYAGLQGPVRWKTVAAQAGRGYVNLLHHFSPKDWVTVYALAYVHAEQNADVQLRIGSNDTVKVWLDGALVWRHDEGRGATLDDDVVPVHLQAGTTPVLLKVSQTGKNWGFLFRITDAQGRPAPDVRVDLSP